MPWNWGSLPLMYDPAVVSAPPESWLDIMKPEYKGKVAMVDDPLGNLLIWGTVVTGKPMGTHPDQGGDGAGHRQADRDQDQACPRLLRHLWRHGGRLRPQRGDGVSAIGWEAVAVWAKAKGKTIKYTIPKEGTGMFMDCLCIPKDCAASRAQPTR